MRSDEFTSETLDKANALVEFLTENGEEDVTVDDIEVNDYDSSSFTVMSSGDEYYVYTDDEADEAFRDYEMSLIEDLGIQSFSKGFQNEIINNFVDEEPFREFYEDDYFHYATDIAEESDDEFGNRLVRECYEADLISDDDFSTDDNGEVDYTNCTVDEDELVELLRDYMVESLNGNFAEQFEFDFGKDDFTRFINENNAIDWDAVIEEVKIRDGRGLYSSYDGIEHEYDDYFIYRMN